MSDILIPQTVPTAVATNRFARNGKVASATALGRVARGYNNLATYQKRALFSHSYRRTVIPASVVGSVSNLKFPIHTSENIAKITCLLGLAPNTTSDTGAQCKLILVDQAGATIDSTIAAPVLTGSASPAPSEITWAVVTIDTMAADTTYECNVNLTNHCRVMSVCAFEESKPAADTTENVCVDPASFQTYNAITDAGIEEVLTAGSTLWKHNAATLFSWSRRAQATAPVMSSATYTNVLDGSSTTPSATTPGMYIDTQYKNTRRATTLPVLLLASVSRVTGSGTLTLRLNDGTNTVTSSAMTWPLGNTMHSEALAMIAQASTKWDLQASVSSGTWRIEAVSLIQYEV